MSESGYIEVRGFGFDANACEQVARAMQGAVAVSKYGPSRELSDYTAWVPCRRDEQAKAMFVARNIAGGKAQPGRWAASLPYGTRAVWDTTESADPCWR